MLSNNPVSRSMDPRKKTNRAHARIMEKKEKKSLTVLDSGFANPGEY